MSTRQIVNLEEFARTLLELGLAKIRVALPGRVESYDAATNKATVKILIPDVITDTDGNRLELEPVIVHNVPQLLDRGGGYSVTRPLAAGDDVELLFNDRSLDRYRTNGEGGSPEDGRRHHLNDAVALPGLNDFAHPPPDLAADHMSLGPETPEGASTPALRIHLRPERIGLGADAPAYAVALAEKVFDELSALRNTVDSLVMKFNTHGHPVSTTGTASAQTGSTIGITGGGQTAPAAVNSMASSKVKVVE